MPGLQPTGVPRGLRKSSLPVAVNDIAALKSAAKGGEKEIAAIVIEPARGEEAPPGYLKALTEYSKEIGAVLVFDEITSGFRINAGGIHNRYGVNPDIAVFAKSMANGYSMSAILGTEKVMQAAQTTFISSTNWTDRVGPVAALATLKKYQRESVDRHIIATGSQVKDIWRRSAQTTSMELNVTGLPSLAAFSFKARHPMGMNTRFTIEMLKEGYLGFRQFKPSLAHRGDVLALYETAVARVFAKLVADPECNELDTPTHHAGFQRLTKE
jgi:glutamate-1-semialdehyde aminotransferase